MVFPASAVLPMRFSWSLLGQSRSMGDAHGRLVSTNMTLAVFCGEQMSFRVC